MLLYYLLQDDVYCHNEYKPAEALFQFFTVYKFGRIDTYKDTCYGNCCHGQQQCPINN